MREKKLFIHPSKISWEERGRKAYDQKHIEQLKRSITELGQLQPVLVTPDLVLVVGGCRTRACLDLDRDVWYSFVDSVDPVYLKEAELAENIHRNDFTPAEVVLMKDELRKMREARGEKATVREVSAILGESKSQTAEDLKIAMFIRAAPQVFEGCKTKSELRTKVKNFERKAKWNRLAKACENLPHACAMEPGGEEPEDHVADRIRSFQDKLGVEDCFTALQNIEDESVDIFLLDPGYGIDRGGEVYEDTQRKLQNELPVLLRLCYQKAKGQAHMVLFFAIRHFDFVFATATEEGWHCCERPIIMCKEGMGGNSSVPDIWPGAAYEPLILARKGPRKLVKRGLADWFTVRPLAATQKLGHPNAKPPEAYIELLSRIAYPGDVVCDPMYGTGAAFVACESLSELHLQWFGWDSAKENKAKALMNLSQFVMTGKIGGKENEDKSKST